MGYVRLMSLGVLGWGLYSIDLYGLVGQRTVGEGRKYDRSQEKPDAWIGFSRGDALRSDLEVSGARWRSIGRVGFFDSFFVDLPRIGQQVRSHVRLKPRSGSLAGPCLSGTLAFCIYPSKSHGGIRGRSN